MTARPPEKSLYDVTLVGPGIAEPEKLRCTPSEILALEAKGYTISARVKADGHSAFAEATQALSKLCRHAELTGNAKMQAKANDAVQALLRDNPFLSGGAPEHPSRERTMRGMMPAQPTVPGAHRKR